MRRLGRWLLNATTALSLLLCATTLTAWVAGSFRDAPVPFTWHGLRWELRRSWGGWVIDNAPQREEEAQRHERLRRAAAEGIGWGTSAYWKAVDAFDDQWARQAPRPTPPAEHRLPVMPIALAAALLPAVWLAARPTRRHRFVQWVSRAAVALSIACALGAAALWVRSARALDVVTLAPCHVYRALSGGGGVFLQALRVEDWAQPLHLVQSPKDPNVSEITPLGGHAVTPIDYSDSNYAAARRESSIGVPLRKAGCWDWRPLPPTFNSLFLQVAWATPGPMRLPKISRVSQGILSAIVADEPVHLNRHEQVVGHALWLPYWLIVVALLIAPAFWLRRLLLARQRKSVNACLTCGYDLTGNLSGVCPECGKPIAQPDPREDSPMNAMRQ